MRARTLNTEREREREREEERERERDALDHHADADLHHNNDDNDADYNDYDYVDAAAAAAAAAADDDDDDCSTANLASKGLQRSVQPLECYRLLKFFLLLWKCLELLKADWGCRRLGVEAIATTRIYREFT